MDATLIMTDESETQIVLDAAVEPARHAAEDAYTANATPLTELNSLPVVPHDNGNTAVAAGLTYENAVDIEFLRLFTVADTLKPGPTPEDSLHRMELWDTQDEPPQELPAVRALTVVVASEK